MLRKLLLIDIFKVQMLTKFDIIMKNNDFPSNGFN